MFVVQTLKSFVERVRGAGILPKIRQNATSLFPFAVLAIITLAPFYQVIHFDFLNFDDNGYVTENVFIQQGLSWQTIRWAFTSSCLGNWHPLTWIALIIQYQNVGADPVCFHLFNVFLHLLNTLLLFLIFKRALNSEVKGFVIAVFFAVHPMHVESVAWISELKDVLSTFWGLLSLYYYQKWASNSNRSFYHRSIFFYVLSLLSKQTLVTFPIILLFFDFWPLKRTYRVKFASLIQEKIPYFIASFAAAMLTFWAQSTGGAVQTFKAFSFDVRLTNSISAYFDYIAKLFFPFHLSVYYPYIHDIPRIKTLLCCFVLIAVTFLSIRLRRKTPYFFFGWFFYLITLLPVIGIVQIGSQAMANRYTYVSYTGLFIIISIFACDFFSRSRALKITGFLIFFLALSFLTKQTFAEVGYWRNSQAVFQRAVDMNPKNYLALYQLGDALRDGGKSEEAKPYVQRAIALLPNEERFHNLMALIWLNEKNFDEAKKEFKEALRLEPHNPEVYNNLGGMYMDMKEYDLSLENFKQSIKQNPDAESTYVGLLNCAKAACNFEAIAELLPKMEVLKNSSPQIKNVLGWLGLFKGKTLSEVDQSCKEQAKVTESIKLVQMAQAANEISKVSKVFKVQKVYRLPTR